MDIRQCFQIQLVSDLAKNGGQTVIHGCLAFTFSSRPDCCLTGLQGSMMAAESLGSEGHCLILISAFLNDFGEVTLFL